MPAVTQFDNVRIATTPETERLGYAGRCGVCYGFTTPSVTGVTVIGDSDDDYALNVHFDQAELEDAWFSADLVGFVDHGPGMEIRAGNTTMFRRPDGTWEKTSAAPPLSGWRRLFKRG